jgi:uncharacterized protein (TIGR03084 family)
MLQESQDLRAELEELHAFLETLDEADWEKPTAFKGWTPWDVIAHLHFYDRVSMLSLEGEEAFIPRRDALLAKMAARVSNADMAREELGSLGAKELLANWIETGRALADALGASDPKRRLPWFGPDMGIRMFTTARYMECWAHAQEIYDLKRVPRSHSDRIRNIATIGVKTFGWTFVNRRLEVPGPPPYVRLEAPSGEIWEWNDPSETERIEGKAVDFCHVVTQGRNITDTELLVEGDVATYWMSIAQCFAGGAEDPPKPGQRTGA